MLPIKGCESFRGEANTQMKGLPERRIGQIRFARADLQAFGGTCLCLYHCSSIIRTHTIVPWYPACSPTCCPSNLSMNARLIMLRDLRSLKLSEASACNGLWC